MKRLGLLPVALEVAAAASFAGLRGLCAMKQNGLNVASDFLLNLNLTGCNGGLVLVVADDPAGVSSSNEEDSRIFAKLGDLPLLEPATFQEAKDMMSDAFRLSEEFRQLFSNTECFRKRNRNDSGGHVGSRRPVSEYLAYGNNHLYPCIFNRSG